MSMCDNWKLVESMVPIGIKCNLTKVCFIILEGDYRERWPRWIQKIKIHLRAFQWCSCSKVYLAVLADLWIAVCYYWEMRQHNEKWNNASPETAQGFRRVLHTYSIITCFCDNRKLDLYLMYPWLLTAGHKIEFRKEQTTEKWNPDFSYWNGSHVILRGKKKWLFTLLIGLLKQFPTNSLRTIKGVWIE